MENDPLAELLRNADAVQPQPIAPGNLAARVRRRVRRGRVARGALTAGLLLVVGGASFWFRSLPVENSKTTASVDIAGLKREFARLNADAELHERIAQQIITRERSPLRSKIPDVADANEALSVQLERSALTLLNRGDSLLRDPSAKAEAAASFRRILELFPQSRGAALARERLNQIGA
ncbi:MAG: hypothetical protein JWN40_2018 [Phycisphaerales bacterium]|nr:hypothetical protein [Phycisphaerales bacterium]